jgi:hypothetical protein
MRVWVLYDLSKLFSFVIVVVCLACLTGAFVVRAYQPRVSELGPGLVKFNNIIRSASPPIH